MERDQRPDRAADDQDGAQRDFAASAAEIAGQVRPPEALHDAGAEFERQTEMGRRSMHKYRNVLAALAK